MPYLELLDVLGAPCRRGKAWYERPTIPVPAMGSMVGRVQVCALYMSETTAPEAPRLITQVMVTQAAGADISQLQPI